MSVNISGHFLPHTARCGLLSAGISIYSTAVGVTFCGLTCVHKLKLLRMTTVII